MVTKSAKEQKNNTFPKKKKKKVKETIKYCITV